MAGVDDSTATRVRAIFHGRVQGVFFRATSRDLAHGFAVTGTVRNRPDGTVELEAQGAADQVRGLLEAIGERYREHITRCDETTMPLIANEAGFLIRY